MIDVTPSGEACGAIVTGVDFSQPVDEQTIQDIRAAWMEHHVLAFPDQHLSDEDLERITRYFGLPGDEPFFETIDGCDHVVALTRRADEKAPLFAGNWHSDWSFQKNPPIGTCLYGITIPPVGGETSFVNQQKALAEMPAELRSRLEGRTAIHSAKYSYAPEGLYGDEDAASDRSIKIVPSEKAKETQPHAVIINHPESGHETLIGCPGYIVEFEGLNEDENRALLRDMVAWQGRDEFQYTHKWQANMLVIWDNRSVLHKANGGYDGYDRELHRTTIYRYPDIQPAG